ncbi:MAG: ABC transporter permease subunit, partial [Bdellovibrionales bacterium]|nr:ABC transporter permease subunit [Bdellovibrionales bacterium]
LASTVAGLKSTDPQMLDLFRLYGASPWKTTLALRLPWANPQIFTGLRIAAGLAVIGAIVGEFVAGGGLGSMIDSARTQQRIDIVFAAVFLSTICGFLVILCVDILKQKFVYGRKSDS